MVGLTQAAVCTLWWQVNRMTAVLSASREACQLCPTWLPFLYCSILCTSGEGRPCSTPQPSSEQPSFWYNSPAQSVLPWTSHSHLQKCNLREKSATNAFWNVLQALLLKCQEPPALPPCCLVQPLVSWRQCKELKGRGRRPEGKTSHTSSKGAQHGVNKVMGCSYHLLKNLRSWNSRLFAELTKLENSSAEPAAVRANAVL